MAKILIVDDDDNICTLFSRILSAEGHQTFVGKNAAELFCLLPTAIPEVILLDVNLPDAQGYDLVPKVLGIDPFVQVLMISGEVTVEAAMNAMKLGAFDYLSKPFTKLTLLHAVGQALNARRISIHSAASERVLAYNNPNSPTRLTGSTRAICSFNMILDRLAKSANDPVMISGEIGTPKKQAARAIHDLSTRCNNPFFHLKCSSIPRPLMISELFGDPSSTDASRSRGLLQLTDGGTLYLSEVEFLDNRCCQALVELIQDMKSDSQEPANGNNRAPGTRLIFSTQNSPSKLMRNEELNKELYEITKDNSITLPNLVEQIEDLEELSNLYLKEINGQHGRYFMGYSPDIKKFLRTYSWPGNHKELYNLIERMVLLTPKEQVMIDISVLKRLMFLDAGDTIHDSEFFNNKEATQSKQTTSVTGTTDNEFFEPVPLEWVEKEYIAKVLKHLNYDLRVASLHLGISSSALHRKLVAFDLLPKEKSEPVEELDHSQ
ncbi:MAG: sigma-54-dependent transcriptional regulator [Sumerlaeia bacterium]